MNDKYEERLGTDRMLPLVFRMALPAIITQIVDLLYSVVNQVYIGYTPRVGTQIPAGVGMAGSLTILISAFSAIVAGGGAPLVAIALGQGNRPRVRKILGNSFVLLLFFMLLTSALFYPFMELVFLLAGAPNQTLGYATGYLSIYLVGTLFIEVSVRLNTLISTQGRPGIAILSTAIGALFNILPGPLFIFVLRRGVEGATFAITVSQAYSAAWVLVFLTSGRTPLRFESRYMRLGRKVVGTILALGAPPFIMTSTESSVGFILNRSPKMFGDIYVSALAIVQNAMLFANVPLSGSALGLIPIIGHNYGCRSRERVKECFKIVMTFMFLFNFTLILLIILFPSVITPVFTSNEKSIEIVVRVMSVFLAGMAILGLQWAYQNMFVVPGQAKVPIFVALLRKMILLVPLALILPRLMDVVGVYVTEGISDTTAAIYCTAIFAVQSPKVMNKLTMR